MKKIMMLAICIVSAVMFGGNSMVVNAAQSSSQIICDEQSSKTSTEEIPENRIALPKNIGETNIIYQDEDGTFSVTLIEASENLTRGTDKVNNATYEFTYKNILGITKTAYKVYLTCKWTQDGTDSKLNSLEGRYEVVSDSYSCEWVDSSYGVYRCTLDLAVKKNSVLAGTYQFMASIFPVEEAPDKVDFDYFVY